MSAVIIRLRVFITHDRFGGERFVAAYPRDRIGELIARLLVEAGIEDDPRKWELSDGDKVVFHDLTVGEILGYNRAWSNLTLRRTLPTDVSIPAPSAPASGSEPPPSGFFSSLFDVPLKNDGSESGVLAIESTERELPLPTGFAAILLQKKIISAEQLAEAEKIANSQALKLQDVLAKAGYATPAECMAALAEHRGLAFIDLTHVEIPKAIIELVPESVARENIVLPLSLEGRRLKIVTADPDNPETVQKLQFILNFDIVPVVGVPEQILEAINRHYGQTETESVDSMLVEFTDTAIEFTQTEAMSNFPQPEMPQRPPAPKPPTGAAPPPGAAAPPPGAVPGSRFGPDATTGRYVIDGDDQFESTLREAAPEPVPGEVGAGEYASPSDAAAEGAAPGTDAEELSVDFSAPGAGEVASRQALPETAPSEPASGTALRKEAEAAPEQAPPSPVIPAPEPVQAPPRSAPARTAPMPPLAIPSRGMPSRGATTLPPEIVEDEDDSLSRGAIPKPATRAAPPPAPTLSRSAAPAPAKAKLAVDRMAAPGKVLSTTERRATVRYYSRMNPDRVFPLLVMLTRQEVEEIVKKYVEQKATGPLTIAKDVPLEIEPVLPGCQVHPPLVRTILGNSDDVFTFHIVPHVLGEVTGARVFIRQDHKILAEIKLDMRVVQRTMVVASGLSTFVLPAASAVMRHFNVDLTPKDGSSPYLALLNFLYGQVSPLSLTLVLALVTFTLWWFTRPKGRDVFWDITTKPPAPESK